MTRTFIILSLALVMSAATVAAPLPPVEDDLTKLARTNGTWVDRDKDCKFKLTGGGLKVLLPASNHMLGTSYEGATNNAPRALREVEGDFTAVVRVNIPIPDRYPKSNWKYVSGGLLAWDADENYFGVRFCGGRVNGEREVIWGHYATADKHLAMISGLGAPTGKGFVRLKREGREVAAAWSRDGQN